MKPILNKIEKRAFFFQEDPRVAPLLKEYYDLHGTSRQEAVTKSIAPPLALGAIIAAAAVRGGKPESLVRFGYPILIGSGALGTLNALENERIVLEGMGYKTNLLKTRLEGING